MRIEKLIRVVGAIALLVILLGTLETIAKAKKMRNSPPKDE